MNARKPTCPPATASSCTSRTRRRCSTRSSTVSMPPNIIVAVVEMSRRCASRMTSSHSSEVAFLRRDVRADAVDEDLGAAAGQRVETGVAQARAAPRRRRARTASRGGAISGGPKPCTWMRVARLELAQHALVPLERQVGVHAALQQDRRPLERDRLLDLRVELVGRQHVGVGVVGVAVEGAEAAARDADVGVVDVAVDDEGDLALGVRAGRASRVAAAARSSMSASPQEHERLVGGEAQVAARPRRSAMAAAASRGRRGVTTPSSSPKTRISGTRSSWPIAAASAR